MPLFHRRWDPGGVAWRTWDGVSIPSSAPSSARKLQRGTNPVSFLFPSPRQAQHPLPVAQKRGHRRHHLRPLLLDVFLHVLACCWVRGEWYPLEFRLGKQTRTFPSFFSINPPKGEEVQAKEAKGNVILWWICRSTRAMRLLFSSPSQFACFHSPLGPSDPLRVGARGSRDAGEGTEGLSTILAVDQQHIAMSQGYPRPHPTRS